MRHKILAVLAAGIVAASALAEEPGVTQLRNDLAAANAARDVGKIKGMLKRIDKAGRSAKDRAAVDDLATELAKSLKVCKRDADALGGVVDALGGLRSKKGAGPLKRLAFRKDAKDEQAEEVQSRALVALGKMADPRLVGGIADQTKNRSNTVAKGAYAALGSYASAPGRTRKKVAELLMKRIEAEYPAWGGSSGKRVSKEKRERWRKVAATLTLSLQAVCHQATINDIANWREWWRENKRNPKAWRDENAN